MIAGLFRFMYASLSAVALSKSSYRAFSVISFCRFSRYLSRAAVLLSINLPSSVNDAWYAGTISCIFSSASFRASYDKFESLRISIRERNPAVSSLKAFFALFAASAASFDLRISIVVVVASAAIAATTRPIVLAFIDIFRSSIASFAEWILFAKEKNAEMDFAETTALCAAATAINATLYAPKVAISGTRMSAMSL
ncbi:MAG: hypothetical protein BWY95_02733 [Bacteroidetes bacterium ADurb.BinA104]|nr:MAG: hypothetical protein BWY95_02733 [Bacteroidetes bacterium ADurb.BinA104]